MSTSKYSVTGQRMSLLAKKNEKLFHIDDLANLWNIQNKNNLRMTLKRYVRQGLLYRIYRGFYSVIPFEEIDPVLLGVKAFHGFCYLTLETILFREGYINQSPTWYTFAAEKPRKIILKPHCFSYRQMHPRYLYNPEGITLREGALIASPERAICDILYFLPQKHFDRQPDWKQIRALQKKIGYPLTPERYAAPKTC